MRGRTLVYFSRLSLHYHDFLLLLSFFRLSLSVFAFAFDHLFLVGKGGGRKVSERASEFSAFGPPAVSVSCFLVAYFLSISIRTTKRKSATKIEDQKWAVMPDPGGGEER